ncbi:MAG TPA: S8 family serine peptidase [Allosphingosinicella sp.]|jgi:hypothetical protein|nr:S8 family serine peptidase [Allosphingosinicella sp.]
MAGDADEELSDKPLISTDVVNRILYGCGDRQRFTQETPILVEVWQRYAASPGARQDLLITPLESTSAVALLRDLLRPEGDDDKLVLRQHAQFAPLQSFLAAKLTFKQLIHYLLPRTLWAGEAWKVFETVATPDFSDTAFRQVFISALSTDIRDKYKLVSGFSAADESEAPLRGQLLDIARILTLTAIILVAEDNGIDRVTKVRDLYIHSDKIVARIADLLKRLPGMAESVERNSAFIWRISSNREIRLSDEYSRATVKADAAFRLFDVKCAKITWAVIDSGVDRDHPGFYRDPKDPSSGSRVERTYDFSILRELLDPAFDPRLPNALESKAFKTACERSGLPEAEARRLLENIHQSYETEMLDWSSIEPLLIWKAPEPPTDGHGTHVAGIIGADMRNHPDHPDEIVVQGLCPDIRIMDFRIISETIENTEFAVIGALQLVRYLNSHNQYIVVHGANLSLSVPHVVESFACGRTPVCDECERLVGAGVTVVAAAGNYGYHKYLTEKGTFPGYATLSITDPGNADGVITVGATHRRDPHTYGISYFSSRGPTGDGRMKPDLVAPGEKIHSTLPNGGTGSLDGTSQAAPHVSAAAAMLMARYPELNRDPRRIKQLLCESATDLGRERAFQGHGLLDTLRALQSY